MDEKQSIGIDIVEKLTIFATLFLSMQKNSYNILFILILLTVTAVCGAQPIHDSSTVIVSWKLTDDFSKQKMTNVDTLLEGFETVDPTLEQGKIFNNTGVMGGPAQNQVFHKRLHTSDFFVVNSSLPYLLTYANTHYYNTRRPFTSLHYTTDVIRDREKAETVNITHAQNITPTLNVGGKYRLINARGRYDYQPVRKNSGQLFGNYFGEHYSLYTSINVNKHEVGENGGIHDSIFYEEDDLNPDELTTRIAGEDPLGRNPNAKNTLKTRNLFLMHKYRLHQDDQVPDSLPESRALFNLEFAHLFKYDIYAKYYEDQLESGFYENQYINNTTTGDSLIFKKLSNTLRVEFNEARKYNVAVRADLTHEMLYHRYYLINDTANKYGSLANYTFAGQYSEEERDEYMDFAFIYDLNKTHIDLQERYNNIFTSVALYNKIPRQWDWIMNANFYLAGYKAGDFNLYGEVERIFGKDSVLSLNLGGDYQMSTVSPMYKNFYTNHFKWENRTYQKENKFTLSARLGLPRYNTFIQFTQTNLYNYVYLNEDRTPDQISRLVSVNALEISNKFKRGIFRAQEYVVLQQSTDEGLIDLPLVSLKAKLYVKFPMLFESTGGRLDHVIGFSLRYNTEYYADAYMPALMSYYKQRDTRVGNYPYVDVFWNIKLKEVRFLLKYEHVNHDLLARDYFLVPEYPQPPGVFKVGVAWTFYN